MLTRTAVVIVPLMKILDVGPVQDYESMDGLRRAEEDALTGVASA